MPVASPRIGRRSPHSARLERWFGAPRIKQLSRYMSDGGGPGIRWYGPPVLLLDCPGSVSLTPDGDFVGTFERGFFQTALDALAENFDRLRKVRFRLPREAVFGAGFANIGEALARASAGFSQPLNGTISKTGPTGVAAFSSTLWRLGAMPAAGAAGSAAPGGRAPTSATTGAMVFANPSSGTLHLTGADFSASVINNALMLYDRIFDVAKTMNSTSTEAVTGVPARYQSSTPSAANYAGGNFLFVEVGGTALAATGHNWTVCLYRNQAGTDNQTLPLLPGSGSAIVDRFDMPTNSWFAPLANGDSGIMDLAQMQASAAVATGAINFVIGHPIGIMTFPVINILLPFDWLTNRNQAPRIFDNAALALFELPKPTTTSTIYNGMIYATAAAP